MDNEKFTFTRDDKSLINLILKLKNNEELYHECIQHGKTRRYLFNENIIYERFISFLSKKI